MFKVFVGLGLIQDEDVMASFNYTHGIGSSSVLGVVACVAFRWWGVLTSGDATYLD